MGKIIGLAGPMGSGKSTVAGGLAEVLRAEGHEVVRFAFADPIRAMLFPLMDYGGVRDPDQWMSDRDLKEAPIPALAGASYRKLAQTLGTEWGRNLIDPTLWTLIAMHRSDTSDADYILIDDVRFDSELRGIHDRGGIVVNLTRSGRDRSTAHASEVGVAADYTVDNNGPLWATAQRVRGLV